MYKKEQVSKALTLLNISASNTSQKTGYSDPIFVVAVIFLSPSLHSTTKCFTADSIRTRPFAPFSTVFSSQSMLNVISAIKTP
jgi:hypothetical protein